MVMERRTSCRISIACKLSLVLGDKHVELDCHTENLSSGGVMVIIKESIAPSTEVNLELFLWNKETPLKCKGRVSWFNEISPEKSAPHLFNTGIEFTEMSDSDKEEIGKFIQYIISEWR